MGAAAFKLGLLALLGAACTSIHAGERTFAGTRWRVAAINGHPAPLEDRYYLAFGPVGFEGRMGCNTIQGGYRVVGEAIVTGPTTATQAGCYTDAPNVTQPMTFEGWAFEVIRQPMRMTWTSSRELTLGNAAGSIRLERAR